jgi:hypothetical protein
MKRPTPPSINAVIGRSPTYRTPLSITEKTSLISSINTWLAQFSIRCESQEYKNYGALLNFRCLACSHSWRSSWHRIRSRPRCLSCNSQSKPRKNPRFGPTQKEILGYQVSGRRMTNSEMASYLAHMKEWTTSNGIELQESTYRGHAIKVRLRCLCCGLKWKAKMGNVRIGRGCPRCSSESIGEAVCRAIFEYLFDAPFKSVWVPWLKGKGNSQLQLDGYNSDLKIAFEHQGRHHVGPIYGKNAKSTQRYRRTLRTDKAKRVGCKTQGVTLIEVPEIGGTLRITDAQAQIIQLLEKAGIRVPRKKSHSILDLSTITRPRESKGWDMLKAAVASRGGRLLSRYYLGWKEQHIFKCSNTAHPSFTNNPSNIISLNQWCPRCGAEKRNSRKSLAAFEKYEQKARSWRIEICTSRDSYKRQSQKLKLRCLDCGASFSRVAQYFFRHPNFCKRSRCNMRRKEAAASTAAIRQRHKAFARITQIAGEQRIVVHTPLSAYKNRNSILHLECEYCGKQFTRTASSFLFQPNSCTRDGCRPTRGDRIRNTLERRGSILQIAEFRKIAKTHSNGRRRGKCLSTQKDLLNTKSLLTFECEFGHRFASKARDIKYQNSWCTHKECLYARVWRQRRINKARKPRA